MIQTQNSGVDMDDDLNCCIREDLPNKNSFYWIEYGIIFNPSNDFLKYCIDNYLSGGKSSIQSNYLYGNFYENNTEYNHLINLIRGSKKSVLMFLSLEAINILD